MTRRARLCPGSVLRLTCVLCVLVGVGRIGGVDAAEKQTLRQQLFSHLTPAFEPAVALKICRKLVKRGESLPARATIPVGGKKKDEGGQLFGPPKAAPAVRVPLISYIVGAWVQIHQSGAAGAHEIPSLSLGAPESITDLIQCIAKAGATFQPTDDDNPLLTAVHAKDIAITQALTHLGAPTDVGASDDDTFTPLHAAVSVRIETASLAKELLSGDARIKDWLETLLEHHRSMFDTPPSEAWTEGIAAAEEALLLFEDSAPTYPRQLLLRIASLYSSLFVHALLSSTGTPPAADIADYTGRTALHTAVLANNAIATAQLCHSGFSATARDKTKQTPIQLAALNGHTEVLRELQACGADTSAVAVRSAKLMYPLLGTTVEDATDVDTVNGGWGGELRSDLVTDFCDIPQRQPSLTASEFFREFYVTKTPVIIRGGALGWKLRQSWSASSFTERFGDRKFATSRIPYPAYFGASADPSLRTISDIVRCLSEGDCFEDAIPSNGSAPFYVFERSMLQAIAPELMDDFPKTPISFRLPPVMHQDMAQPQFFLGPIGSGAPPHFHGDAWNAAAFGSKRWFFQPPLTATYSKTPIAEWYGDEQSSWGKHNPDTPLQCTQYAGDVVYVPRDWGHAVLNAQNTIGVAVEFSTFFSRY